MLFVFSQSPQVFDKITSGPGYQQKETRWNIEMQQKYQQEEQRQKQKKHHQKRLDKAKKVYPHKMFEQGIENFVRVMYRALATSENELTNIKNKNDLY